MGSHFLLLCHFDKIDSLLLGRIVDSGDCSALQGLHLFHGDGQAEGGKVHESFTNNCVLLRPLETSGSLTWVTAFVTVNVHILYTTYRDCKVICHSQVTGGSAGRGKFGSCTPLFSHVAFLLVSLQHQERKLLLVNIGCWPYRLTLCRLYPWPLIGKWGSLNENSLHRLCIWILAF